MPEAWMRLPEDREVLNRALFRRGDIIELKMTDEEGNDQGSLLLLLTQFISWTFVTNELAFCRL